MPKTPPLDELPELSDPSPDDPSPDSSYDLPPELEDEAPPKRRRGKVAKAPAAEAEALDDDELMAVVRPRPSGLKVALVIAAVLALGGGLLWYRAAHRARTIRQALAEAETLMRLDTAAAYRAAAAKLEIPAQMDPVGAGSARAFALAMLACDYRDAAADSAADELLVAPERAEVVPDQAYLARAALALGKGAMGDASNAASHAQSRGWAEALQARIAMGADRLSAAVDPAAAAAAAGDGAFAPGLAIEGDVARRARKDPAAARAAYTAALAAAGPYGASPRATFGLAKLALAGQVPPGEAVTALERLLQDGRAPAPERGRAALHLASLRLRAGDVGGAQAALDAAALDPAARAWAEKTARTASARRGIYRAAEGAPASLQSRSDDDPPEAEPPPPPPPPEPRKPAAAKAATPAPAKKGSAPHGTSAKKGAATKKPAAKKTRTAATR